MSDLPEFKPKIIDVVVLVDAPRILYHYGPNKAADNVTFKDYQQIGPKGEGVGYIYMATTWFDAQGEGGSELKIFGVPGNKIRWRARTLSMGGLADASISADDVPVAFQVFIRGFVINSGQQYITPPTQKVEVVDSWGFDATGKRVRQQLVDVYWESEVVAAAPRDGEVVYHMPFNILCTHSNCNDNNDGGDDGGDGGGGGGGNGCGGYTHDPFIYT